MKETILNIEGNPIYKGYAENRHWNGWACPWFDKKTSTQIMYDYIDSSNENAIYNKSTDTFIFYRDGEDEPEQYSGKDFIINGEKKHLYPIGNTSWIWDDLMELYDKESFLDFYLWEISGLYGADYDKAYKYLSKKTNNMNFMKMYNFIEEYINNYKRKEPVMEKKTKTKIKIRNLLAISNALLLFFIIGFANNKGYLIAAIFSTIMLINTLTALLIDNKLPTNKQIFVWNK